MNDLKKVGLYRFNPLLKEKVDVENNLLRNFDVGTASPSDGIVLLKEGDKKVKEIDISNIDPKKFLSSVSLADAAQRTSERIDSNIYLKDLKGYDLEVCSAGDIVTTRYQEGKISNFVCTKKVGGDYFDYTVYKENYQRVYYSNKSEQGLGRHSGDLGSLVHHFKFENAAPGTWFVLTVTGFRKKNLVSFAGQLPAVLLANVESETVYLVPCPLDGATMGNATMACLIAGTIVSDGKGGKLVKYVILPNPTTVDNADTGTTSQHAKTALDNAIQMAKGLLGAQNQDEKEKPKEKEEKEEQVKEEVKKEDVKKDEIEGCVLHCFEKGIEYTGEMLPSSKTVHFGLGLSVANSDEKFQKNDQDHATLPLLFGTIQGSALLALGRKYRGKGKYSQDEWHALMDKSPLVQVHMTGRMNDKLIMSAEYTGNALYILHPDHATAKALAKKLEKDRVTEEEIHSVLNTCPVQSVSAMSGPNSIVLVQLGSKLFFYRGVCWDGLLDDIPVYGQDVTEKFSQENILKWVKETGGMASLKFNTVYDRTSNIVYYKSRLLSVKQCLDGLGKMGLPYFGENKAEIIDLLQQLKIILGAKELNEVRKELQTMLDLKIKNASAEATVALREYLKGKEKDRAQIKLLAGKVKGKKTISRKNAQWLINELSSMTSIKGSSSKTHDLHRQLRKSKMAENVEKSNNMTMEELGELIDAECDSYGCLMATVYSEELELLLKQVKNSKAYLFKHIQANTTRVNLLEDVKEEDEEKLDKSKQVASLDKFIPSMDALTLGILLAHEDKSHPLKGSDACLALPGNLQKQSLLPFPLYDKLVNLKDPSKLHWVDYCNQEYVAVWRIKLRSTIANAVCSRKFAIKPQDRQLGYALVHTTFCVMEGLARTMKKKFGKIENMTDKFDDPDCQMMRGMFGQLFTLLGSGENPLSLSWQMVKTRPGLQLPEDDEWWMYERIISLFPFSGWNPAKLENNVRRMLVKLIKKRVVDQVTEPMRKGMAAAAKAKSKECVAIRNTELKFIQVACTFVIRIIQKGKMENSDGNAAGAKEVLTYSPEYVVKKKDTGFTIVHRFITQVAEKRFDWDSDKNRKYMVDTVLRSVIKRAGIFRAAKHKGKRGTWEEAQQECEKVLSHIHKVAKIAGIETVYKMKNYKGFVAKDRNSMKGDAELNRKSWGCNSTVGGYSDDELNEIVKKIKEKMGVKVKKEVKEEKKVEKEKKEEDEEGEEANKLVVYLKDGPNPSKAVELAEKIRGMSLSTIQALNFPHAIYIRLFHSIGFSNIEIIKATKKVMRQLLMNWNDPVKSEELACNVLNKLATRKAKFQIK